MEPSKNEEKVSPSKLVEGNDVKTQLSPQSTGSAQSKQVTSPTQPVKTGHERTEEEEKICRKYIWGKCEKPESECRYIHIRDINYMKKILKFCNDFQNHGCSWPNCTYLHTSREEVNLFKNFNKIPQILLDRYAKMEENAANYVKGKPFSKKSGENIASPGTVNVKAGLNSLPRVTVSRPFPPPVPITNASNIVTSQGIDQMNLTSHVNMGSVLNVNGIGQSQLQLSSMNGGQMGLATQPQNAISQALPGLQPNLYSTVSNAVQNSTLPTSGTAVPPIQPVANGHNYLQFPMNAKLPPPVLQFDKTKPPPTFSVNTNDQPAAKRMCIGLPEATIACRNEADPSREDCDICIECIRRRTSIDSFNKQIEKLMCEKSEKEILYQQKLEHLLNTKKSFLGVVGTENRTIIENYIDGTLDMPSSLLMQTIMATGRMSMLRKSNQNTILVKLMESLLISINNKDIQDDFISHDITNITQNNLRVLEVQQQNSPQVHSMNHVLQQLISLSGTLLMNNQMNSNPSANMTPNNVGNNAITNNQTQTTSILDNGQNSLTPRTSQPDPTLRVFDPNLPPPSFSYYQSNNYMQANGLPNSHCPPNTLPPNTLPPNALPPNPLPPNALPPNSLPPNSMAQGLPMPFQNVMHPGQFPMPGAAGPMPPGAPGNGIHQGAAYPTGFPSVTAPLQGNLPPQQPEQLMYTPMTPYYYPFH